MNPLMQPPPVFRARRRHGALLRRVASLAVVTTVSATVAVGVSACSNDNGSPGTGASNASAAATYVGEYGSVVTIDGSTLTYKGFGCDTPGKGAYSDERTSVGSIGSAGNSVTWTKRAASRNSWGGDADQNDVTVTSQTVVLGGATDGEQPMTFVRANDTEIKAAQDKGLKSLSACLPH